MNETLSSLAVAHEFLSRGWMPLPIAYREKNPNFSDWQKFNVSVNELSSHFNGKQQNIGVLLGKPSNSLVDVDHDCSEVVSTSRFFLPKTGASFGRPSNRDSHKLFVSEIKTKKFSDPIRERSKDENLSKQAMIIEIRSTGCQTVFPCSTHKETGEVISWVSNGEPAHVSSRELSRGVAKAAAAALLARYWQGTTRHDASLALIGGLLRAKWSATEVERFIKAVCVTANDEELRERINNIAGTQEKLRDGSHVTGFPRLAELTDEKIVKRVCEWLEISTDNYTTHETESKEWSEPDALPDALLPVPELAPEMLPDALREWLLDSSERVGCPLEFLCVTALVTASSLLGSRVRIRPKRRDSWTVSANLWGANIGEPSSKKSPALTEGLRPLRTLERIANEEFAEAMKGYGFDKECVEAKRAALKQEMRKVADIESLRSSFEGLDTKPPVCRRFIVSDATTEKLGALLGENSHGLLVMRDELIGLLHSLDDAQKGQDRAFYLEAANGGGAFTYDRIERGTISIKSLTLALVGGIQPSRFENYVRDAVTGRDGNADGLLQRFQLVAYPDLRQTFKYVDRYPNEEAYDKAFAAFKMLSDSTFDGELAKDELGNSYHFLRFDDEAQEFFAEWLPNLERRAAETAMTDPALSSHLLKSPKTLAALALIFHTMEYEEWDERTAINLEAVERAAAWCEFFEAHARRVYSLGRTLSIALARKILDRLRKGELFDGFSERDIYRKQWVGLSKSEDVRDPLDILCDTGWLRPVSLRNEDGGRPKTVYFAHPSLNAKQKDGDAQ